MSALQHAWSKRVLLTMAVFFAACGSGISNDPAAFDRPPNLPGDERALPDAASSDDGSEMGDGGREAGPDSSGAGDTALDRLDRAAEGDNGKDVISDPASDRVVDGSVDDARDRDGSDDGSTDASIDRSADVEIDRDASIDAGIDRSIDVGVDRDAAIANSDGGDVSSESSDAPDTPQDTERDVVTADTLDGCTVDCGQPEFDYYVDASAPLGGDGSKEAPFRTIGAAVAAHAQAPNQAHKAYVAAGTYDEALGEAFPLVLRGLSLQGAGADRTFIVGTGMFDHAGQGGPKNGQYMVTVVAGDRILPTKVSRLSLRPVAPVPSPGYHGVFCDRGNATGEVASPAGQTHFDEMSVGPGFDTSVFVVTSTNPVVTGCNLLMTRSTVTGGWTGIEAVGCEGPAPPGPVMLQMGTDDPASGNTVTWMQSAAMGNGIFARECVVRASFQYNTVSDCNNGLVIQESSVGPTPGSMHPFLIKHNTFARMTHQGFAATGISVFIDELSDNRFFGTTRLPNWSELGMGMRLWAPIVGKVRRNLFAGNDVGLVLNQGTEQTDLGRPGDPGENVFSCNSGIDGWAGADVMILYPMMSPLYGGAQNHRRSRFVRDGDGGPDAGDDGDGGLDTEDGGDADGPVLLPFAGNSWDHDPPRVAPSDFAENGLEVRLDWAPPLVFDVSGSSLVTSPCPAGRIP